ncbi:MAG: NAD(P)/FAD-dependent oxidoreductase [Lentisphaeraceae bacterium]|nr:NAD(P)/FAD-dependent oxidoreductase [Lentisphaeraceae bacterium]
MKKDVIIIGAGAAGMMCAIEAGKRGRNVLLVDHSDKPGRKIIISGGGRCNFTNMGATPANYLSQNPHFCKSAFKRYTQYDFVDLVEKHEIPYHEKKLGQLFCDRSAKDIVKMLLTECEEAGVEVLLGCKVEDIVKNDDASFTVKTGLGDYQSESVVISSGGLSVPGTGASGFGFKVAEKFGLEMIPTRAALVPFLWDEKSKEVFISLAGNALPSVMSCGKGRFEESFLFTHKGLSGPAVLQISNYWEEGDAITIDLLPEESRDFLFVAKNESPGKTIEQVIQPLFPKRVFATFKKEFISDKRPLGQIPEKVLRKINDQFKAWQMLPADTEGYRTAEVTIGGVDTNELSSKTMEAKKVSGLYFIGEVVDVTGWLGGYNFQWAWSSGWCCGQFC